MSSQVSAQLSALRLFDLIQSHRVTAAIYVAARLGLAELLRDGPLALGQLAKATGADERALGRLLTALSSIGICSRSGEDRYASAVAAQLSSYTSSGLSRNGRNRPLNPDTELRGTPTARRPSRDATSFWKLPGTPRNSRPCCRTRGSKSPCVTTRIWWPLERSRMASAMNGVTSPRVPNTMKVMRIELLTLVDAARRAQSARLRGTGLVWR